MMATVNTTVTATDLCDPNPIALLVSATSNEPDDAVGGGDGQTTNDIQDATFGTPDFQVLLRAERQGQGTGRVYTLTYNATDRSGNLAAPVATFVNVPHDLGSVVEPISLRVDGKQSTRVTWGLVDGAVHYDVIRGNLENLKIEGSNVNLGSVTCIEQHSHGASTVGDEDNAAPAPGKVFFYAVQFFDSIQDSSYGSEDVGRARVVKNGDCP